MERLNYHHLYYFWTVAREGGLLPAGRLLRLSHPTLSAQVRALEAQLGEPLFSRAGRRLALTETGQLVFRYAGEIFALGSEMAEAVRGHAPGRRGRLDVGITDVVPKLVVQRLLEPAFALKEPVRIVCHEDRHERLLAELALHALDLVIADAPVPPGSSIRAYSHLLGECGVTFFAAGRQARARRGRFPRSLDGAPLLLPTEDLPLRRDLDHWFASVGVRPRIVAEFADSALLKTFGAAGAGIFPAPSAVEKEVIRQYRAVVLGRTSAVKERYYAISVERRLKNPAVLAIQRRARREFLGRRAAGA